MWLPEDNSCIIKTLHGQIIPKRKRKLKILFEITKSKVKVTVVIIKSDFEGN